MGKEVLVGVIHSPEKPNKGAILAFAAGGPQYRAGVSRQLVYSARKFTELGIPFMRFDYRGMGDSSGTFTGFDHIEKDITAGIKTFLQKVRFFRNYPESEARRWGAINFR
jgi:alpha/beta superfamily hydrolase